MRLPPTTTELSRRIAQVPDSALRDSWIREAIKDDDLAQEIAGIEHATRDPNESREHVKQAIEHRYTAGA